MANLESMRRTPRSGPVGTNHQLGVAASTTLYGGSLVAKNASGFAVKADDDATLQVVGVARNNVSNAGNNGDKIVIVDEGVFGFDQTGTTITKAHVGELAYVADDHTVTLAAGDCVAGVIEFVQGNQVFINVGVVTGSSVSEAAVELASVQSDISDLQDDVGGIQDDLIGIGTDLTSLDTRLDIVERNPVLLLPSGDTTGATDRAAIVAALTAGNTVWLGVGTFYIDQTIALAAGKRIAGFHKALTIIKPGSTWTVATSGADTNTNTFFSALSTLPGSATTTTSATFYRNATSFSITSAAGLTIGDYVTIETVATGNHKRIELCKIANLVGTTVTPDRQLRQDHASGASVYKVTTLVSDVSLETLTLDASSDNHACGIVLSACDGFNIDIQAKGFARAQVECRRGSDSGRVRIHNLGGTNCMLMNFSSHYVEARGLTCSTTGDRYHSAGIARALVMGYHRPHKFTIRDFSLHRGCTAICVYESTDMTIQSGTISDMQPAVRITRDGSGNGGVSAPASMILFGATRSCSGSIECGAHATGEDSGFTYGAHISDVHISDIRLPDSDGQQACGPYLVDFVGGQLTNISVVNTGYWSSTSPYAMAGFYFYDVTNTVADNLSLKGVDRPFTFYGGFCRIMINSAFVDFLDAQSDSARLFVFGTDFGDSNPSDIKFGSLTIDALPTGLITATHQNGNQFPLSWARMWIGQLNIQNTRRKWQNILAGYVTDGTAFATGDACEIRKPITCTFTNGSSAVGAANHGLLVNQTVYLDTDGTLPANFAINTRHYVKSVTDPNTIVLSTTRGGTAVTAGSAGSGNHRMGSEVISLQKPTAATAVGIGHVINGGTTDQPANYHFVEFGGSLAWATLDDTDVGLTGDRVEYAAGSATMSVNNAATVDHGVCVPPTKTGNTAGGSMILRSV